MTRRAVFLDRDGVLNRAFLQDGVVTPPRSLAELEILPGVPEALRRLRRAGWTTVVVTNQPDVARGLLQREVLKEINARLQSELELDDFRVCMHDDADHCECRKPKPGMLLAAAGELGLDLSGSYMIGDSWRDAQAGRRAGCRVALIADPSTVLSDVRPDARVGSLAEAAEWILSRDQAEEA